MRAGAALFREFLHLAGPCSYPAIMRNTALSR
jgi:hypothetical protein